MLKHIVFFRFQPEAEGRDAAGNALEVKRQLESLPAKIAEIRALEVGVDMIRSERSWDLALYSAFDDLEAMKRYQVHPAHQEVIGFIKKVASSIAAVDYEA
ncbi:MAG: Dabb family protein [Verrucomicrobiota bacterium JB022]|nr:Dabb family protein [Verrucomicrobiota bacterium JB022]